MADVSIAGLDKAEVLAALVNAGCNLNGPLNTPAKIIAFATQMNGGFTVEAAQEMLGRGSKYVDYAGGVAIKCDFSGDSLSLRLYDRDQSQGAGEKVIAQLREQKKQKQQQ